MVWLSVFFGKLIFPFDVNLLHVAQALVSSMENLQYASPLYYYNNPDTLLHGINVTYAGVLLVTVLVCYAFAHLGFAGRDIN